MSREVPYSENEICDVCGKKGAYDFMGDLICDDCYDPTPCCYQHGVGAISTNESCPEIADND